MAKHEKLTLDELSASAVVNKSGRGSDNGIEDFINNAVQEHIKKIAQPPRPLEIKNIREETPNEDNILTEKHDSQIKEASEDADSVENNLKNLNEDKKNIDESSENSSIASQNVVNDETSDKTGVIENETVSADSTETHVTASDSSTQQDLVDANLEEHRLSQEKTAISNMDLANKLLKNLSEIVPAANFDEKVAKLSAEAISGIAKKLHLVLPVNFEEIICKGLIDKLNKFYKEGIIVIKIHPERYDFCSQILQLDEIPAKFKGNFKIEKDNKLTSDDCIVEWNDTILEYSKEQLSEEIDIIIERLTNAA